jgi:uncharacterized protein
MRVVLDTNVLLSACWTPTGLEARIVSLAISGRLTACVSPAVLSEYRDVLFRPKFAGLHNLATDRLNSLERTALVVIPSATVQVSPDDDDNRLLECAAAAKADFLVTGNLRHYPPCWGETRIVNARGFFDLNAIP